MLTGAASAEVPANRLTTLSRGVNVTSVFDMDSGFQQLLGDLPTMAGYGFHHIRIFIDPKWVTSWNPTDAKLAHLDQTIATATKNGLGVILCMAGDSGDHPNDHSSLAKVESHWRKAWTLLATRYYSISPDKLFFELANEPSLSDVAKWAALQDDLRREVRAIAPHNTLLLTSTPDSTVWALGDLPLARDDNVVYTFHLYQPMVFTHQGAEWGDAEYASVRGLEYPPNPANISAIGHRAKSSVITDLLQYQQTGAQAIEREVQVGSQWAHMHHVHVVVTEFGVYKAVAPAKSRAYWLKEARRSIEAAGFGWSVWEWNSGFGVKQDLAPPCAMGSLRDALGLCHS